MTKKNASNKRASFLLPSSSIRCSAAPLRLFLTQIPAWYLERVPASEGGASCSFCQGVDRFSNFNFFCHVSAAPWHMASQTIERNWVIQHEAHEYISEIFSGIAICLLLQGCFKNGTPVVWRGAYVSSEACSRSYQHRSSQVSISIHVAAFFQDLQDLIRFCTPRNFQQSLSQMFCFLKCFKLFHDAFFLSEFVVFHDMFVRISRFFAGAARI